MKTTKNRLGAASSAYLRQHAANPVAWYTWGPEALDRARTENKPILLSIGYAACHWCHVMARESFEDPDTAAVMNASFVNIKVDREERPDLDHIYQAAHQLLTRQPGGWPLTVFLAPDQAPFFSGTYFPREPRFGLPGFRELLAKVATAFAQRRREVGETGQAVREALAQLSGRAGPPQADASQTPERAQPANRDHPLPREGGRGEGAPRPEWPAAAATIAAARQHFRAAFDLQHGGLGHAPKFPRAPELDFCLAAAYAAEDAELRHAVLFSLRRIAEGGLQDHLAGGFFRYCVDGFWEIPHFEKMLYDNALLLRLFADAFALDRDALFREAAEGIVQWLTTEMRAPEGLFYSSLDADAEHQEGKFYVWSREEVATLLSPGHFRVAAEFYGLTENPNFEGHAWHLRIHRPLPALAQGLGQTVDVVASAVNESRARLLAARSRRVRPGLDDKRLTAWNALTITALARAARVFARPDWLALARGAHAALLDGAWLGGRLAALAGSSEPALPGYLDDYAFVLEATLELLETDYRQSDFEWAIELAQALLRHFRGEDGGGFFFTANDHEALLARMRTGFDQATPSGNGVAAKALLRLWHLTSDRRYQDAAEETLSALAPRRGEEAEGRGALLCALLAWSEDTAVVWLRGALDRLTPWCEALPAYRPQLLVLNLGDAPGPPAAPSPRAQETAAMAWVCRAGTCTPPIVNLSAFLDVMAGSAS
ncbi:hypothetical protein BURK2_02281 [Burkholderiales bacterium]|nr:MAG: thioredoxin domain-containing protein [Burkholderiales bacterium]CAG0989130.1 hypothetical protein BURK2_02281 [Burkholderiales bacterium]